MCRQCQFRICLQNLYINLSVHLCLHWTVNLAVSLSVCIYIGLFVNMSAHLSLNLFFFTGLYLCFLSFHLYFFPCLSTSVWTSFYLPLSVTMSFSFYYSICSFCPFCQCHWKVKFKTCSSFWFYQSPRKCKTNKQKIQIFNVWLIMLFLSKNGPKLMLHLQHGPPL